MDEITINPEDCGADVAAYINAALAAYGKVILGPGLFLINSPIFVPSGKTLEGAGADLTMIKASESFALDPAHAGVNGVVNSFKGATDITLEDFSVDASKLMVNGGRLNAVFMYQATDFAIARVDVYNATGYGHFAQGEISHFTVMASGTYDDCWSFNANVHFEQMAGENITLTNVHARDGDGDIGTEAYFHPLVGSRNITYIDVSAYGHGYAGFNLTSIVRPLENITIINADIEITRQDAGSAIIAMSYLPVNGLYIENSRLVSEGAAGVRLGGVSGTAVDTYFQGEVIGVQFLFSGSGVASSFVATRSHTLGTIEPNGGGVAYGIVAGLQDVHWVDGVIETLGRGIPIGSDNVTLVNTELLTTQYSAMLRYSENDAATAIAPGVTLSGGFASFAGGNLTVSYYSRDTAADSLAVADQGDGPGQISVDGEDVSYEGTVIGTLSDGDEGGLIVVFGPGATLGAVQALARAITFANDSELPAAPSRLLHFEIVDGEGNYGEFSAAVIVTEVPDAPVVDLDGGPGSLAAVPYVENDGATVIAPLATVADVDSAEFAGGSLTVSLGSAALAGDRLTILHQGNAAGQIGVAGNVVSYGGVQIGTVSGGQGTAPLVVSFTANVLPAAAQALVRSIAFHSLSDAPGAARTATFALNDGHGATGTATADIAVTQSDDPTVARNLSPAVSEHSPYTFSLNEDVDGNASPVTTIAGVAVVAGQTVTLASGARVTLNADGTVTYDPNGKFARLTPGSTAPDGFTYALENGGTASVAVTVNGQNTAATVDLNGANAGNSVASTYVENAAAATIAPGATVVDPDTTAFNGATLTVGFTTGATAAERLSVRNEGAGAFQVGLNGSNVTYAGVVVGTLSGGIGTDPLVITFNGNATATAVQTVTRRITYANASDDPTAGLRTATFTFSDGGGATSAPVNASIYVNPVQDLPVAVDDSRTTSAISPVTIAVLANDSDPDGPAMSIARINGAAVTAGQTLTLASGARLTLNADGTLTYDPNGKFEHLTPPSLGGPNTSALETFTYTLRNGGTATVNVTVNGRSVAPTIDLNGANAGNSVAFTYVENAAAPNVAPGASIVDPDSSNFNGGRLTVALTAGATGDDRLAVRNEGSGAFQVGMSGGNVTYGGIVIGTVSGGTGADPLVVAFNDKASATAVQAVTRRISYSNVSDDPVGGARTVTFTLTDGAGGTSAPVSGTIHVTPVADAATAVSDAGATDEATPITIAVLGNDFDPDGPAPSVARIAGTSVSVGQTVTIASGAKVTLAADGTLSYDPSGKFNHLADGGAAGDSFTYSLRNGGTATVTVTVNGITFTPVVDLDPAAPGTGAAASFTENGTALGLAPAATVSDSDSADFAGGSVTVSFTANGATEDGLIVRNLGNGAGQIGVSGSEVSYGGTPIGTLSGGSGGTALTIALNANATPAAVQALVRALAYSNSSEDPSGATRTVTITVNDGDGGASAASVALAVTPVNDAPVADLNGANTGSGIILDYIENGAPTTMGLFASLSDPDTSNFSGGSLTVAYTAGGTAADRLSVLNEGMGAVQVGRVGNDISFGGVVIGTLSGGEGTAPLVITFNAQADTAAVQAVMRRITYQNLSENPSTAVRTLAYTVADGEGGTSSPVTATIHLHAVDDPATAVADAASTGESTPVAIAVLANDSDADGPVITHVAGTALAVGQSVTLASGARVTRNADGTLSYDPNGKFAHLAAPGSGASETSAIDSFSYTLRNGNTATVTVTVNGVASAGDRLIGTAGNDAIHGSGADDLVQLQQGGNDQSGGAGGADRFYLGAAMTAADLIDGGAGTDLLLLQGDYRAGLDLSGALSTVETVRLLSGADTSYGDTAGSRYGYALATGNGAFAAGSGAVSIDGSGLLDTENLTFDGSGEADAAFSILGGAAADTLTGGGAADVLRGGGGGDTLAGGGGSDSFVYGSTADSTQVAMDRISGFAAGDGIDLSLIDANSGTAGDQGFTFIASNAFSNVAGQLRVEQQPDSSWLIQGDVNGDGAADLVISVSTSGGHMLAAGDFVF